MDRTILESQHSTVNSPQDKLWTVVRRLLTFIRYRFMFFAGVLPYILGAAVAYRYDGKFELFYFLVGFIGIVSVLIGVEILNEYFDFKIGGDRVFLPNRESMSFTNRSTTGLKIAILLFIVAFCVAVYLTLTRSLWIMIFAIIGGLSAIFYLAPPIQLSYRGFGEMIIFLNYGPFMTVGSYFLQTKKVDLIAVISSLIPGFLILSLCLINEIPDYYSDKLVGKKNIVVRLGRKKTVILYIITLLFSFLILAIFIVLNNIFLSVSSLAFLTLPIALKLFLIAIRNYETPNTFISAIRGTIFLYIIIMSLLIASFVQK